LAQNTCIPNTLSYSLLTLQTPVWQD
jgi:hypothetical protein